MEQIEFRDAHIPDDFWKISHLWKTAGPGIQLGESDSISELEKKIQHDPELFIIAEVDGQIIGSVLGGFDGRRGIVYHLAVSNSYRNMGIGSNLMAELETRLQKKGCIRCYLLVTPDNQEAMKFYLERKWEKLNLYVLGKDIV